MARMSAVVCDWPLVCAQSASTKPTPRTKIMSFNYSAYARRSRWNAPSGPGVDRRADSHRGTRVHSHEWKEWSTRASGFVETLFSCSRLSGSSHTRDRLRILGSRPITFETMPTSGDASAVAVGS